MSTIAFIGLGQMGLPMASNLIKKGETLRVFDINKQAIEALVKLGAYGASSAVDAAKGADFVITMLPNGDLVKSVLFGEQGICDTLSTDALFIDMSTIHPLQSDAIAKELAHRNIRFMDAPVGRTSDHAISGNLLILAGGKDDDVKKAEPILMKMGNEMIKAGGLGMGIRLKIINNFMSIALNTLSAEAAVLCEALGLSLTTAIEMMSNTPAGKGHFSTTWPNKVLKGDLTPSFMIELAHKDIGIALDVANQLHVPMPMGAASREVYNQAKATGRAKQDWSAILQHVREISGYSK